jgi:hypothetical protein
MLLPLSNHASLEMAWRTGKSYLTSLNNLLWFIFPFRVPHVRLAASELDLPGYDTSPLSGGFSDWATLEEPGGGTTIHSISLP